MSEKTPLTDPECAECHGKMARHQKFLGMLTCPCGAIAIDLSTVEGRTGAEKIYEIVNVLKMIKNAEKGGRPV
jgi:hypothetical protein